MTGLDLFFHHVESLTHFQIVVEADLKRVAQMLADIEYDGANIIQYARSLTSFYHDIASGLNTGCFTASDDTIRSFSLDRDARLPKFLLALTSSVFERNGVLLEGYNRQSVEHLLTLLSLTKRVDSIETTTYANEAAVESYKSSQTGRARMTPEFRELFKLYWETLLFEWDSCITWGDLGPGALLDKEFPFERHLALPALFGAPLEAQDFLERCLRNRFKKGSALMRWFPEGYGSFAKIPSVDNLIAWLKTESCLTHSMVFAYSAFQPSRLSVVEKSCLISRPITVTWGWLAILQACLRATGKKVVSKIWGIASAMNVDDQSLSHQFLYKNHNTCFTTDFRNGSGNFLHEDIEGSLPGNIAALEAISSTRLVAIPSGDPKVEPEYIEAVTLQMGDSACNFFLTASTFFLQVASIVESRYRSSKYDIGGIKRVSNLIGWKFGREEMRLLILESSKICHCVGDDFIGDGKYYQAFRTICADNNIEINEKKSSAPGSILLETCGSWVLNHGASYTEIFPFRAPKIIPGFMNQTLLNCTQYLHKISHSEIMCRIMAITLSKFIGNRGYELLSKSRSLDEIGNPFGNGAPLQAHPVSNSDPSPITDTLRAFFYISEDLFPTYGKEGERSRPMRYKLSRSTKHHATYCDLENRGRIIANRDKWIATSSRVLSVTQICASLRLERLLRINSLDIESAFAGVNGLM